MGLTLFTGVVVAEAAGGFTFGAAIRLSVANSSFLYANLFVAAMMTLINTILVNLVFELGLAAGSAASVLVCKRKA
ncbi:MAG: hypothetical protein QM504_13995 [Pseudomonadota bacterium]